LFVGVVGESPGFCITDGRGLVCLLGAPSEPVGLLLSAPVGLLLEAAPGGLDFPRETPNPCDPANALADPSGEACLMPGMAR